MLKRSTLQLLRIPFSFFLMPVFWFALSFVNNINWPRAILLFVLIHLLLYPASNGYNSYMDRDTDSIGGVKNPLPPERELFTVSLLMDIAAILLSLFAGLVTTLCMTIYVVCSRLYSYRGIRLKRYAIPGYLTVILNQGALVFFMVCQACGNGTVPWQGMIAASLLIGGFYPITQIYQHAADAKDGVHTISMMLGKRGTFIFCAIVYTAAFSLLFLWYSQTRMADFWIIQIFFLPVIIVFLEWFLKVWKDDAAADFKHTMRMNLLASACTNLAFITLIIIHHFD